MEIKGRHVIALPIEQVWQLINDPAVLEQCIPGCEALTERNPRSYSARVKLKIGPVKATFNGDVEMTEVVEYRSFRLVGKGAGGVAGMASGHADVTLEPGDEGTILTYGAEAEVAGKLAQLGSRLIDSTVKKLANRFFDNFEAGAAATCEG